MPKAAASDRGQVFPGTRDEPRTDVRRLRMSRFEELADTVEDLIFPVRWQAEKAVRRLPVDFTAVRLGGVTISDIAVPGQVCASTTERGSYHVVMVRAGQARSEHGGTQVRVSPAVAAVYPPSGPTATSWAGPHDRPWSVTVEAATLVNQLAAHLGEPITSPITLTDSMSVAHGAGRSWSALIQLIYRDAVDGWPLGRHPALGARLHDAVVLGLLAAAGHRYREEWDRSVPVLRPRPVKQAIDVIEAHPDRPLPVSTIARMAGVSVRTLQSGFRQYVGMTPTAYARRVRLARAHRDLHDADPHQETVAEIAHRWGFAHLGRFAAAYRAAYGITPAQTLRNDKV